MPIRVLQMGRKSKNLPLHHFVGKRKRTYNFFSKKREVSLEMQENLAIR